MDGGYGGADGEAKADAVVLSVGYRDCEQAFARSVFDFMAHTLELGFTELVFCSAKHCMESPFYASTIRGTIFGGVTYDLFTIR